MEEAMPNPRHNLRCSNWECDSLCLMEQEWLKNALMQTEHHEEHDCRQHRGRFSRLSYKPRPEMTWYSPTILSELSIPETDSIYNELWKSDLNAPYLWFFLGQFWDKTSNLHLGAKLKIQHKLLDTPAPSLIHFPECQEYSLLLDRDELQEEIRQRLMSFEKDGTFSHTKKMSLSEICERMSNKLDLAMKPAVTVRTSDFAAQVEKAILPPDWLAESKRDWSGELSIPLQNSLPSMFLHRCFSPALPLSSPQRELHPVPQFIQSLSRMVARFSILRHFTPEEVERMVRENKDWTTEKRDIQWLDPQEKWFYWNMPAINLFYDRFRDDFRHTVVTDWEEPEKRFSLSKAEIDDTIDFSNADHTPVFKYDDQPNMTIGSDLNEMESLMDKYSNIYKEESKKELAAGEPKLPNLSWTSESILKEIKDAKDDL